MEPILFNLKTELASALKKLVDIYAEEIFCKERIKNIKANLEIKADADKHSYLATERRNIDSEIQSRTNFEDYTPGNIDTTLSSMVASILEEEHLSLMPIYNIWPIGLTLLSEKEYPVLNEIKKEEENSIIKVYLDNHNMDATPETYKSATTGLIVNIITPSCENELRLNIHRASIFEIASITGKMKILSFIDVELATYKQVDTVPSESKHNNKDDETDTRIQTTGTKEELETYFTRCFQVQVGHNVNGKVITKQILQDDEIKHILLAGFSVFEKNKLEPKRFTAHANQNLIMAIIYDCYIKYRLANYEGQASSWLQFLLNSFTNFKDKDERSLGKKFCKDLLQSPSYEKFTLSKPTK